MSARPYDTFQSEGWYNFGRAQHYVRRIGDEEFPLVSLCGNWRSGDGIRPWLGHSPTKVHQCQKCKKRQNDEIMKPQSEPWFGEVHP